MSDSMRGFAFRSDCITHEFASAYFRHFHRRQIKDRVSTGLDAANAFALDFRVRTLLSSQDLADSGRFTSWGIELEDRHWIHSDFSSDAFELYLGQPGFTKADRPISRISDFRSALASREGFGCKSDSPAIARWTRASALCGTGNS